MPDYVQFLRSILEGQQLSPTSLKTMMNWVSGTDGKPVYGMGLYYSMLHGRVVQAIVGRVYEPLARCITFPTRSFTYL